MNCKFIPVKFEELKQIIMEHTSTFASPIDGFLVDHILGSNHYRILINDLDAGHFSIHGGNLITGYYLEPQFSKFSQQVFLEIRHTENVQAAFVPTCDEFLLAHALDDAQEIKKQAYFFTHDPQKRPESDGKNFSIRVAEVSEFEYIKLRSHDFFIDDELVEHLKNREVRISYHDHICVGFGLIIRSKLFLDVADIGMVTREAYRRKSFGRLTVQALINECLDNNIRISAGCWYYNHNSKKTLESAGMVSHTRLLKVHY